MNVIEDLKQFLTEIESEVKESTIEAFAEKYELTHDYVLAEFVLNQ